MSETPKSPAKAPEAPAPEPAAKPRKEIPLIAIQDDGDMIAEEMAEMFDEDRCQSSARECGTRSRLAKLKPVVSSQLSPLLVFVPTSILPFASDHRAE